MSTLRHAGTSPFHVSFAPVRVGHPPGYRKRRQAVDLWAWVQGLGRPVRQVLADLGNPSFTHRLAAAVFCALIALSVGLVGVRGAVLAVSPPSARAVQVHEDLSGAAPAWSFADWVVVPAPKNLHDPFQSVQALLLGRHVVAPEGLSLFDPGPEGQALDVAAATAMAPPPQASEVQAAIEQGVAPAEAYGAGGADFGASSTATAAGSWDFNVDGYTSDPWGAQAAVDGNSIAYIDYGNGFAEFAGHNTGAAAAFLNVGSGDTVNIGGRSWIAGDAVTVAPGTSIEGFQGTWIQTCDANGNLQLRQIY